MSWSAHLLCFKDEMGEGCRTGKMNSSLRTSSSVRELFLASRRPARIAMNSRIVVMTYTFPPRTPARNAINPPQHMAQQLGFPDDVIFSTVYYNGQPVMPFTLLLHFSFAIVFSILFILLIQKWKQVGMAQGAVCGLIIWVA